MAHLLLKKHHLTFRLPAALLRWVVCGVGVDSVSLMDCLVGPAPAPQTANHSSGGYARLRIAPEPKIFAPNPPSTAARLTDYPQS
jgi:hypothetical protein